MRVLHLICIYVLLGLVSCTVHTRETREAGKPPVVEKIFAAKVISTGDPWKVYIKASDPEGDMNMFILDIHQASSLNYLGISRKNRERLSGYLLMYTNQIWLLDYLFTRDIKLTVIVEDSEGNRSQAFTLPLSFDSGVKTENPAVGVFEEEFLGIIPIEQLQPGEEGP
jgi:hypothetical protein